MKDIMLIFRDPTVKDSESYIFPNIEEVKVTVEGIPNSIGHLGDGITPERFYLEDKFALVIDLRSVDDHLIWGSGRELVGAHAGVSLKITKNVTPADLMCDAFVISDCLLNIKDKIFNNVTR